MRKAEMKKVITGALIALVACAVAFLIITDIFQKNLCVTEKYSVAMGTVITQKLYSENDVASDCDNIIKLIENLEDDISWRKKGSAIYSLNKNNKIECDDNLKEIFALSQSLYEASNGAFDITVGSLTTLWNIGEENARLPKENEIEDALKRVDGSSLKLSGSLVTSGENQIIDLGAVGKGLACDKARSYLEKSDVRGAVVSVGGSVLLFGENETGESWNVGIRDPKGESTDYMGKLQLSACCVSTSGDYERVLEIDGKKYHHILDTKSGYPAQSGLRSVTVVCDSGFMSDALSTASFVLGLQKGAELLKEFDAEGVFIEESGSVYVTEGLRNSFSLMSNDYSVSGDTI